MVALTVTPALSLLLLGRQNLPEKDPPVVRFLKERYSTLLIRLEKHPPMDGQRHHPCIVAGLTVMPLLRGEFLPELRRVISSSTW